MDPRIADYIRANRKKFTRQAITDRLIAAGHDRAEIERTWAALEAPDPDAVAGEGFWPRFALIVIGINVGMLLLLGFLTGALQNAAAGGFVLLIILGVVLAIGALISWGIVAATGPAKLGRTTAMVVGIAIPLVVALLIGGGCYALIGGVGGGFAPAPPSVPGSMSLRISGAFELDVETGANCQPFGTTPADGFGINATVRDSEGREIVVDVSAHPMAPGAAVDAFVSIARDPANVETSAFWADEGPGPSTRGETVEFAEGRVTFEELQGFSNETGEAVDPISGEVAWTCGQ